MSGVLTSRKLDYVYHYAPLHYLPFIARSGALLSKERLRAAGHDTSHFRSTSRRQDGERGFADYVHLTLTQSPPILLAKISRGFPHFEIQIPAARLEEREFHLCRYNIAKSRYLLRPGATSPVESAANGWFHGDKQLPTAETPEQCAALLDASSRDDMIEVLVRSTVPLGVDTTLLFLNEEERGLARDVIKGAKLPWSLKLWSVRYRANPQYLARVREFMERTAADSTWLGDGLEFDRV
jgi:hypothetical protein